MYIIYDGIADNSNTIGKHYSAFHEEKLVLDKQLSGTNSTTGTLEEVSFDINDEQLRGSWVEYYKDEDGLTRVRNGNIDYFTVKITVKLGFEMFSSEISLKNVEVNTVCTN